MRSQKPDQPIPDFPWFGRSIFHTSDSYTGRAWLNPAFKYSLPDFVQMALAVYGSNHLHQNKIHTMPHVANCSDLSQVFKLYYNGKYNVFFLTGIQLDSRWRANWTEHTFSCSSIYLIFYWNLCNVTILKLLLSCWCVLERVSMVTLSLKTFFIN